VAEPVLSPTFTLVRQYSAPTGAVYHVDLYRVSGPEDLPDLGWEELMASDGPVFVEWADRAHGWLPDDRWDVYLEMGGRADTRRVSGRSWGKAPPLPLSGDE
jgi:tRNA threonylcarbamoyl adenosine modification protein YjeE